MRPSAAFIAAVSLALLTIWLFSSSTSTPELPDFPKNNPEARAAWEFERTKDPSTGEIPVGIRQNELAFAQRTSSLSAPLSSQTINIWEQVGPDTLGGRTRALAVDATDENTLIAGAVSGGIWKSIDGGQTWAQTLSPSQLLSITAVAQDTRTGNTDTWYAGTGEATGNSASGSGAFYHGDGIYKSTDGGDSWTLLASTSTDRPESFDQDMDFIWRIVTDASNLAEDEVYAAAYSGIYRSVDGGTSWTEVLDNSNSLYTDVVISSTGVLYAALSHPGTDAGIWRSEDGVSWTNITPGGWSTASNRTTLALAPSNEDVLYTISETSGAGTHDHSLWKYTHSTTTWEDRSANIPGFGSFGNGVFTSQGGYDLLISVKPDDENTVFLGGTSLYRSTDGFSSTNTDWVAGYSDASGGSDNWSGTHHADQHIVTYSPTDPDVMYTGSDGGVHRTDDNTAADVAWTSLNRGYLSGQFYSVGVDHTSETNMALMGGTQDNGTWYVDDPITSTLGEEIWGGDGAFVSLLNEGTLRYASFQNGQIYRLEYNASNQLTSWALATTSLESSYLFIHPYVLDPNDSEIMYLPGSQTILRNTSLSSIPDFQNATHTIGWSELANTAITGGGVISAIMASESNPDHRVYYGTSAGEVYRLDDADTGDPTAVNVTSGSFPSGGYVNGIAIHPDNADRVAVVFSNYSVLSIFYSDDAGATWTDVSGSLEENVDGSGSGPSVRWIKMGALSTNETQYFVGTSTGLYSTTTLDGTSTVWTQEGSSTIGNVVVDMIDIRDSDGYIAVGTHGNGFYKSMLDRPIATSGPGGVLDNLTLWLKADAGIIESGGEVSAWEDQSIEGYDYTDGGNVAYTYDTAGLNFNPQITNDNGSIRRLENTSAITLQTVVIVTDPDSPDGLDSPFSEVGVDDEGIRVNESTATSWNVPGSEEDFTNTTGQGWLNGASGTDPSHNNEPNILVVEAPSASVVDGGIELGDTKSNRYWHGSIAEVIGFTSALTTSDREQVQTYLGIKYGITVSNDYLASDGTTLWDATALAAYHNDVVGIGRDDASELEQKQSSADILTVALGSLADDNASNANTFDSDLSFVILGHDNGDLTESDVMFGTSDAKLLGRTWFVQQTGSNGTVELQFDLSQVTITGTEASDFWLVLDTDTDPVTDHREMIQATSITQDTVSFTNITLENNDYVMLVTDNPGDKLLPVELAHFDAVYSDGYMQLNWATASETNNAGFEVQRKEGDENWSTRAFIDGQGYSDQHVEYSFEDDVQSVAGSTVTYRLKQVDFDGSIAFSDEVSVQVPAPEDYALSAYPNPFNPTTTIQYELPASGHVKLVVFDVQGRQVATLVDESQSPGRYDVRFDASQLSSGTYVYRLESGGRVLTNTFLLVK